MNNIEDHIRKARNLINDWNYLYSCEDGHDLVANVNTVIRFIRFLESSLSLIEDLQAEVHHQAINREINAVELLKEIKLTTDLTQQLKSKTDEINKLRYLLWSHHGHKEIYGDDGEMQCRMCDFKRGTINDIAKHFDLFK